MKPPYHSEAPMQSFGGGSLDTLPVNPEAASDLQAQEAEFRTDREYVLFGGMVALNLGEGSDGRILSCRALSFSGVTGEITGEPVTTPGMTYKNFDFSGPPVTARIMEPSNVLILGTDSESISETKAILRTMPHPSKIAQTANVTTGTDFDRLAHEAYLNNGYDFVVGYNKQDTLTVVHPQSRTVTYLGALANQEQR